LCPRRLDAFGVFLDRAPTHPELVSDHPQAVALRTRRPHVLDRRRRDPRPAEHPASRLGAGQAGVDALDDDRPLELGEDAELNPATQIYCASAQPWVQLGGETKSFDRMPG